MTSLKILGWHDELNEYFEQFSSQGYKAGRVAIENKDNYTILTESGEMRAEVTGKLLFSSESSSDLPKVGDWVVISVFDDDQKAIIHDIFPRNSKFSRKVAGKKTEEQIIATNIDYIFVVQGLDFNFNVRRLERYLVMVHEGGPKAIVILNKVDLCGDNETYIEQVRQVAHDVDIIPTSALTNYGIEGLKKYIKEGSTYAFIGSSGAGKTSLINKIIGEDIYETNLVREKDTKGRHTTAKRELIVLQDGGLLIDTPGMREFQLWDSEKGINEAYDDFTELSQECYFSDCSHTCENGCAIIEAVENGDLSSERYESYIKLRKEVAYLKEKQSRTSSYNSKKKFKDISRSIKNLKKYHKKGKFD